MSVGSVTHIHICRIDHFHIRRLVRPDRPFRQQWRCLHFPSRQRDVAPPLARSGSPSLAQGRAKSLAFRQNASNVTFFTLYRFLFSGGRGKEVRSLTVQRPSPLCASAPKNEYQSRVNAGEREKAFTEIEQRSNRARRGRNGGSREPQR